MTTCTVQRAEALLRSLVGITAAEVRVSSSGRLELVRVATACPLSNGQVVQNVRSALFAGLGVRLDPAQVELVDPKTWVTAPAAVAVETVDPVETVETVTKAEATPAIPAEAPVANGNGNGKAINGRAYGTNGNGHATDPTAGSRTNGSTASPAAFSNGNGGATKPAAPADARFIQAENGARSRTVNGGAPPSTRIVSHAPGYLPPRVPGNGNGAKTSPSVAGKVTVRTRGIELEAVELLRQAGRLRCRVSLIAGSSRYAAVADAAEDTVPEYQLAARVTCDTIRAAQLSNAHFDGAVVAFLAGRTHVMVALSEWKTGNEHVSLTGSAVVTDRLEHAAAAAVLQALHGT